MTLKHCHQQGKHLIHYDDSEEEDLVLAEERWRLVGGGDLPPPLHEAPPPPKRRRGEAPSAVPLPARSRAPQEQSVARRQQCIVLSDSEADSEADSESMGDSGRDGSGEGGGGSGIQQPAARKRGRDAEPQPAGRLQLLRLTLRGGPARSAACRSVPGARPRLTFEPAAQAGAPATANSQQPEPAAMLDTQAAAELLTGLHWAADAAADPLDVEPAPRAEPMGGLQPPAASLPADVNTPHSRAGAAAATAPPVPAEAPAEVAPPPAAAAAAAEEAAAAEAGTAAAAAEAAQHPGPARTPGASLRTPASGYCEPPDSRGGKQSGGLGTVYKTPALRRVSASTAAGETPDWWQATLATSERRHSAAGGPVAGGALHPDGLPADSQAPDSEPLFVCLPAGGPAQLPPRLSAQTPAAGRLSSGIKTPRVRNHHDLYTN